jgi:hypothetical protein
VGPRAGLDDVEKRKFLILQGLELRPLGLPAPSQSLYRLRCPGSFILYTLLYNNCMYKTWSYMKSGTNNSSHIYSRSGQSIERGLSYSLSVLLRDFVSRNFLLLVAWSIGLYTRTFLLVMVSSVTYTIVFML